MRRPLTTAPGALEAGAVALEDETHDDEAPEAEAHEDEALDDEAHEDEAPDDGSLNGVAHEEAPLDDRYQIRGARVPMRKPGTAGVPEGP